VGLAAIDGFDAAGKINLDAHVLEYTVCGVAEGERQQPKVGPDITPALLFAQVIAVDREELHLLSNDCWSSPERA
jgi:hypothetical protein